MKPDTTPKDVKSFILLLTCAGKWLTSAEVLNNRPEWSERYIRALANESGGEILSYPGSPGYKLTACATAEEIKAACSCFAHQAEQMRRRASEIARAALVAPHQEALAL